MAPERRRSWKGRASTLPDGSIELTLPIIQPPSAQTPIQIVIYGPGTPRVLEGTTEVPGADGSFSILIGG